MQIYKKIEYLQQNSIAKKLQQLPYNKKRVALTKKSNPKIRMKNYREKQF